MPQNRRIARAVRKESVIFQHVRRFVILYHFVHEVWRERWR